MERKRIIIAIDGFSSTGKSTMAKTLLVGNNILNINGLEFI